MDSSARIPLHREEQPDVSEAKNHRTRPAPAAEGWKGSDSMVMRNRNEGSDAPHWWDDLPPKVRNRFAQSIAHDDEAESGAEESAPLPSRGELVGDLSRLGVLFVLVALGNILFLLVALSFLNG